MSDRDNPEDMTLETIRGEIDALDDQIVTLLATRQRFVRAAARHKADSEQVRAPDRRRQMMARLRARALEAGADPEVVARAYTAIVDAFIDLELREHDRLGRDRAPED